MSKYGRDCPTLASFISFYVFFYWAPSLSQALAWASGVFRGVGRGGQRPGRGWRDGGQGRKVIQAGLIGHRERCGLAGGEQGRERPAWSLGQAGRQDADLALLWADSRLP